MGSLLFLVAVVLDVLDQLLAVGDILCGQFAAQDVG